MALKMDGLPVKARPIRDGGNTSCDDRFQKSKQKEGCSFNFSHNRLEGENM